MGGTIHTPIIYGIPITTLIFRNYYETVPNELIEAATVDGAGMMRTYAQVVLPISIPSFVVVLIWQFTSAWNDFLFALFFGGGAQYTCLAQHQGLGRAIHRQVCRLDRHFIALFFHTLRQQRG